MMAFEEAVIAKLNKDYEDLKQTNAALRVEVEREKAECDKAHKRAGERWKELDAERQDHAITRADLAAAVEVLREFPPTYADQSQSMYLWWNKARALLARLDAK